MESSVILVSFIFPRSFAFLSYLRVKMFGACSYIHFPVSTTHKWFQCISFQATTTKIWIIYKIHRQVLKFKICLKYSMDQSDANLNHIPYRFQDVRNKRHIAARYLTYLQSQRRYLRWFIMYQYLTQSQILRMFD